MANDENNATVAVDESGGERFEVDFQPLGAGADRRRASTSAARVLEAAGRHAGLLERPRVDARPGELPDGRRPGALGRRPQRRVARREASLRRGRLARPAHALGQPVADDHGARHAGWPTTSTPIRTDTWREGRRPAASTTARSSSSSVPEPEPVGRATSSSASAAPASAPPTCTRMDGLMEAAGVRLPLVLGHENAGWVHAVGDGRDRGGRRRRRDPLPALQLRALRRVPPRPGHALRAARVHRAHTRRRLRGVRARRRALADPAPGRRRACGGRTARRRGHHRLPRRQAARAAAPPRHDGGRDRRRRSRAHRAPAPAACSAPARSWRSTPTSGGARSRAELGADEVLGEEADVADAVREATNGAGADVVLDFVATDETHAAGLAMLARRGLYSTVGYGGTVTTTSVGARRRRDGDRGQPRRQLDRPLGAAPAPRARGR